MAENNDLNINIGANAAGVEAGTRRAKAAVKTVTDESKQLDAAFRRLKSAIDPTFAAQEKYNKSLSDAKALQKAGIISKQEARAATLAAKAALDSETASIMRNSAAGRAAAAELKAAKASELADTRAAATATVLAAREKAAAEKVAAREAAAVVKAAKAEEKAAIREAATVAKLAAREKAAAEKMAAREMAAAAKEAAAEMTAAARARSSAERLATREATEAEKQAKREMKAAARDAANVAVTAARSKAQAEKDAARIAREAAQATSQMARAERQAANAAQELRASIDPAFASQQRFNQTMQVATQLLMQNKLKQGEWIAIQKQAKAQMDINTRSIGRQNSMYVQLGYQAQDVTASLASGINPLVILAQQGGQTAAAMSMMGGRLGAIAAFMAGPWGAAIIGFTLLVGYLSSANSDATKKTNDLRDAEFRRTGTIKELTAALRDYIAAQRDSNNESFVARQEQNNANLTLQARMIAEVEAAQIELNKREVEYRALLAIPRAPGNTLRLAQLAAEGIALFRMNRAQAALTAAQKGAKTATDALTESHVSSMIAKADETELDREHARNLQKITDAYRASGQTLKDFDTAAGLRRQENERYNRVKDEEAEARRNNEKAAKDEAKAIFQSREAAIGMAGKELRKEGYGVSENNQFGGIKGNHPGMGNVAHGKFAIDVNIAGVKDGQEAFDPVAKRRMDQMVAAYQARGFRILWNGKVYNPNGAGPSYDIPANQKQHTNHAHVEAPQSIVGKSAGKKLASELISDAQRVADEQRRIDEGLLQDQVANMEFRKELASDDLQTVLAVQKEKEAAIQAFYGAESKEAMDAGRERIRIERSIKMQVLKEKREEIDQRLALAQAAQDRENAIRSEVRGGGSDAANFLEQNNLINANQALAMKAQILDAEFAEQVSHESRMYSLKVQSIRDQLALENLTLDARRALNLQLETLEAEHLNTMAVMNAQQSRAVAGIQMQSASIMMTKWRDVASTMTQSLGSAFQGLWTRSQTFQQTFINMADQMVYKMADMGLKMFEDWVMRQIGMTAVKQTQDAVQIASTVAKEGAETGAVVTGETTRTAIKSGAAATETGIITATTGAKVASEAIKTGAAITGAATQTTVGAAAGMAEIGTRAATSAAGAFSSTVVIPFIGPVAAPIAAAAALAAVLGFGALISAEGGMGEVPSDQLAMVHKKEMILPAWIAEPMRQNLAGRNSSPMFGNVAATAGDVRNSNTTNGGDTHLHYGPQYGGQSAGGDMEQMLTRDSGRLRRWMKNEMRRGTFSGGSR